MSKTMQTYGTFKRSRVHSLYICMVWAHRKLKLHFQFCFYFIFFSFVFYRHTQLQTNTNFNTHAHTQPYVWCAHSKLGKPFLSTAATVNVDFGFIITDPNQNKSVHEMILRILARIVNTFPNITRQKKTLCRNAILLHTLKPIAIGNCIRK